MIMNIKPTTIQWLEGPHARLNWRVVSLLLLPFRHICPKLKEVNNGWQYRSNRACMLARTVVWMDYIHMAYLYCASAEGQLCFEGQLCLSSCSI